MSSTRLSGSPFFRSTRYLTARRMSSLRSVVSSSGTSTPSLWFSFKPPDARQVVALGVEEQVVEDRGRGLDRRRIARPQAPVDVDDRLFAGHRLVGVQRVVDRRAGRDRVEVQERELEQVALAQLLEDLLGDRLVAFEDDLAGRLVDDVLGGDALHAVVAHEVVEADLDPLDPGFLDLAHRGLRELAALAHDRLAVVGLHRLGDALAEQLLGRRDLLHQLAAVDLDDLGRVEEREQLLGRVAERLQEHGRVQLAAPVDADLDQVLVVELDVEPRAAVRDHAGRVELLARRGDRRRLAGVEEDAGRAVQLADDDPLGPVDDERAVLGHHRDLAEVDLLLLHVADVLVPLTGVVPDDQADRDLDRRGVGHAALQALLDVVLRLLERVRDELERGGLVEIADREDGVEHRLETDRLALLGRHVGLEEPLERAVLNVDQVGDVDDAFDLREVLPDAA